MRYAIVCFLLTGLLWSQSKFACPDSKAKQACSSFWENKEDTKLLKAANTLVCFREERDEYFLIAPKWDLWTWDDEKKVLMSSALPQLETIDHGVSNSTLMPNLLALKGFGIGSWRTLPDFSSLVFNIDEFDKGDGVKDFSFYITDSSLDLSIPYQNRDNQNVTYDLNIALSTGRFRESWHGPTGLPQDDYGRCSGKITLPSARTLKAAMPSK